MYSDNFGILLLKKNRSLEGQSSEPTEAPFGVFCFPGTCLLGFEFLGEAFSCLWSGRWFQGTSCFHWQILVITVRTPNLSIFVEQEPRKMFSLLNVFMKCLKLCWLASRPQFNATNIYCQWALCPAGGTELVGVIKIKKTKNNLCSQVAVSCTQEKGAHSQLFYQEILFKCLLHVGHCSELLGGKDIYTIIKSHIYFSSYG